MNTLSEFSKCSTGRIIKNKLYQISTYEYWEFSANLELSDDVGNELGMDWAVK